MQTVESLIRELSKFPPGASCHAYEGEPVMRADGRPCNSYIVLYGLGSPELGIIPCTEDGFVRIRGVIPCTEDRMPDGPAVDTRELR